MQATITNCKKNIMGTVSFDGRFPGMNKPQDFIVYPIQDSTEEIRVQSGHRFGRIDLGTGKGVMSANRADYANSVWLQLCEIRGTAKAFTLAAEDLQTLRQWVKSTGGLLVGSSMILSDNTGAMAL